MFTLKTGTKQVVFQADDYFNGSPLESNPECPEIPIGKGTLGLAMHPDFNNPATAFVYFMYSYNAGNENNPNTLFKVKRLQWSSSSSSVVDETDILLNLPNGYDHFGGRMMIVQQQGKPYLILSIGDLGISELNAPNCYADQANNPNNFTQDVNTMNGKIHRFNLDGTIPDDNPIPGNSMYTRGHRNPQGLMFDAANERLYSIEHGDHTDDEINVLLPGRNYGWKDVRGYHFDNNHPGELTYIEQYEAHPQIPNDALIPAFYSWCASPDTLADWCTVAPSDGLFYGKKGIPQWSNSLLVVTLKNGVYGDREVYQFKLDASGGIEAPTELQPNPKKWFTEDQAKNGRLRDIAVSPDGQTIYLINNGGTDRDKITVYTYDPTGGLNQPGDPKYRLYPNPAEHMMYIQGLEDPTTVQTFTICDLSGQKFEVQLTQNQFVDISHLAVGRYILKLQTADETYDLNFEKIKAN